MFDNRGRFITVEEKKKVIDKMTIPEIAHEIKVLYIFNMYIYIYSNLEKLKLLNLLHFQNFLD